MIRLLAALALLAGSPAVQAQTVSGLFAAGSACRQIYSSLGTVTVGNNSTARSTMLPAAAPGGTLTIAAGSLPPGASLRIVGSGIISATTVGSPTFAFIPSITPQGGSKTDLTGFSAAPLIGVVGITWLDMRIRQTATGLQPAGIVSYAQTNSANNYPNPINNAGTVTTSDWTVTRTLDVEGQWSVASASNYVTPQMVTIDLCPPGA